MTPEQKKAHREAALAAFGVPAALALAAVALWAILGLPTKACAQQAVRADPLTLKLSRDQVQLLGNAVMELPMKSAAPLLAEIERQVQEQDRAATEAAKGPGGSGGTATGSKKKP